MKKLAIMLVTALLAASLVACGCTDRNAVNNGTSGNGGTGTTQNGGTRPGANTGTNTNNGGANNNMNGSNTNNGIGNNLENAVDDMGDAVDDLLGGDNANHNNGANSNNNHANNGTVNNGTGNNSMNSGANTNPTGFRKMIENGRVHDTDGILTDGENSHY